LSRAHFSSAFAGAYEDFFRAVNVDDARTVSGLLARGFDPNTVDENGQVGLYLAFRTGAPKVVSLLLAHPDIKPDLENAAGETPLMMAALRGEVTGDEGLSSNEGRAKSTGVDGHPLHYAASGPSLEALQFLLERGAAIEAPSPNGTTAVMMAARYGSDDATMGAGHAGCESRGPKNDKGLNAADFRTAGRPREAGCRAGEGRSLSAPRPASVSEVIRHGLCRCG
jgi:ankyrin repeat protein